MPELARERIGPPDAARIGWILHGILGSGRNWRSFARKLVKAHPGWAFVLPDLRNHGDTGPLPPPHTIAACVADLDGLPDPDVVIGHSFGGKVALAWARDRGHAEQVWVLDSIPLPADHGDDSDVMNVLGAVERVIVPAADRSEVRAELSAMGLSRMLVEWLLTSLHRTDAGWDWKYGVSGIRPMMQSYFELDLGPWLAAHQGSPEVHLVRAGDSDRWTPDVLERLELGPGASLHVLPDAGHWLHVDNPAGLIELMRAAFQPA